MEEIEEALIKEREAEIEQSLKVFFNNTIINLMTLEGVSGAVDLAYKIDRKKIIMKVLKEITNDC